MKQRMLVAAAVAVIATALADQVSKWWILNDVMNPPHVMEIWPFFKVVLTWNKGVSFGLLSQDSSWMPYILMGIAMGMLGLLGAWLWQVKRLSLALGIGFVMGGALGNFMDRIRFGAVVDFLDIHAMGWHWPAFNVADSAICLGVAVMVADSLLSPDSETKGAS